MTTKSFSFWLTDAEMAKAKDSHIPDTFIPQIAKHLFIASINGENQQEAILATLKVIVESHELLRATLEKRPANEPIQQESIPELPVKQVKPKNESFFKQIKALLTLHPNGLIAPEIATALSISVESVHRYIRLMEADGLITRKCSGIGRFTAFSLRGANEN
jgi:hypothetical protein